MSTFRPCAENRNRHSKSLHLQAEVPGHKDRFLVYPFGLLWNEVTASNLLLVDMEGKVISGHGQPEATAFWIHR